MIVFDIFSYYFLVFCVLVAGCSFMFFIDVVYSYFKRKIKK